MSKILVFIQQENGRLNSASLSAIKASVELRSFNPDSTIIGVCLGQAASTSLSAIKSSAIEKIFTCEDSSLSPYVGLNYAHAVSDLVKQQDVKYIVGASTSSVKDFFPALTALIDQDCGDCSMVSEVLKFISKDNYLRPMYAGNVLAEVSCNSSKQVISVRSTNFSAFESDNSEVATESYAISNTNSFGQVIKFDSSASERPELSDAKIVVSGGRGLQSKEGFEKYIYPLADSLKAAIGASRAAVDAGFAPNDWQVGQTGKTVAPQLYIAVGLSGAIQHLAGMKDSKVVVAINKDSEAPIFEISDYGLVADLEKAIPELTELIKNG